MLGKGDSQLRLFETNDSDFFKVVEQGYRAPTRRIKTSRAPSEGQIGFDFPEPPPPGEVVDITRLRILAGDPKFDPERAGWADDPPNFGSVPPDELDCA